MQAEGVHLDDMLPVVVLAACARLAALWPAQLFFGSSATDAMDVKILLINVILIIYI
jgi:hypothetical protein